jgi:hypothetical protein
MVLFSFGLPGRFGDWCDAVTSRMAEAALGPVAAIDANTPEELATALIKGEGVSFLINGRQPSGWLRRMVAATDKPFIIALDDPRVATWELVSRNGLELAGATRLVGCSCVSMMHCTALPRALVVHADRDWQQPLETAAAIARHLGLAVGLADIERVVSDLAALGLGSETASLSPDASQPDEATLAVINGAVAPYFGHLTGAALEPITWARELFLADGHRPAAHAVDITGRSRALIHGPYISLSPGKWLAEMVLGFTQEAADMNFVVDVKTTEVDVNTGGAVMGSTSIRPAQQGVFSVALSFMVVEENDYPIEFRVINERAAFDGRVMLSHVTLTRQHDLSIEAVALLTTELGI